VFREVCASVRVPSEEMSRSQVTIAEDGPVAAYVVRIPDDLLAEMNLGTSSTQISFGTKKEENVWREVYGLFAEL